MFQPSAPAQSGLHESLALPLPAARADAALPLNLTLSPGAQSGLRGSLAAAPLAARAELAAAAEAAGLLRAGGDAAEVAEALLGCLDRALAPPGGAAAALSPGRGSALIQLFSLRVEEVRRATQDALRQTWPRGRNLGTVALCLLYGGVRATACQSG